jgi:hypothetical protein
MTLEQLQKMMTDKVEEEILQVLTSNRSSVPQAELNYQVATHTFYEELKRFARESKYKVVLYGLPSIGKNGILFDSNSYWKRKYDLPKPRTLTKFDILDIPDIPDTPVMKEKVENSFDSSRTMSEYYKKVKRELDGWKETRTT